ncbi:NAD(P)H-binding protein [Streptomyces sp. NPDC057199]|uniref:NAD(P)H-binding protein n=1 Tax=Streptomyces sp. NPDC057199 TaxID=3346047 RepID=UPI00363EF45D
MILITGATGTIGSEVVRQLAQRGEKVCALTRDPSKAQAQAQARARARVADGTGGRAGAEAEVEVVRGDYLDPASVDAAMAGASAVFLVGVLGPDDVDRDRALVEQARAAGVRRVVKLSAIGTGDPAVGRVGTWHLPGEQAVRESELEWTVLRPSAFASNTLSWAEAIRTGEPVPNMTGDGLQGVIDPRDVSEVAVEALLSARHAGHTYTLTGPETLGVPDQAAILADVLGRPVTTEDLTPDESRARLTGWGMDAEYVEGVLAGSAYVRGGGNAVVTEEVLRVLGRPPRTYRQWAVDHRAAFGES